MRAALQSLLTCLCVLTACASQPGSSGKPMLIDASSAPKLHGIQWEVKTMTVDGGRVILHPDGSLLLAFAPGGQVGGAGPVNQFRGTYAFSPDGRLTWTSPLVSTRRAGPPELMDKERAFLAGLPKTTRAVLAGDALQLQSDDGSTVIAMLKAGS
jgi:heat shock protein HslJ